MAPIPATKKEALGNQGKACRLLPLHQVLRGTLPISVLKESAMQVGPSSHLDKGVSSSDLQLEPDTLTCPQLLLREGTGRGIQGSKIPSGLGSALSYPPSLLQEGPTTRTAKLGGGKKKRWSHCPAQLFQECQAGPQAQPLSSQWLLHTRSVGSISVSHIPGYCPEMPPFLDPKE